MVPSKITIHCSDSPNGRAVATSEIRRWHTLPPPQGRGWSDIGYHRVVEVDGGIGKGRETSVVGAHVEGHNTGNLGICFVGNTLFSRAQFSTGKLAIKEWMLAFGIPLEEVHCHYEFDTAKAQGKTCPNMKIEDLRAWLSGDDSAIDKYIMVTP